MAQAAKVEVEKKKVNGDIVLDPNTLDEAPRWILHGWNLIKRGSNYLSLPDDLKDKITYEAIKDAKEHMYKEGFVRKTPIINGKTILGPGPKNSMDLFETFGMKCENMQFSGSFKIRGAYNQFSKIVNMENQHLCTISAGNYGAAFAFLAKEFCIADKAYVFMPKTVPPRRKSRIEKFGAHVNCHYPQEELMSGIESFRDSRDEETTFLHPFDDVDVIVGHASAGIELMEEDPDVDIILVCCGGGGFLAGVTAAVRLSGNNKTKVYGIEHRVSCTMFNSLQQNKQAFMKCSSTKDSDPPASGTTSSLFPLQNQPAAKKGPNTRSGGIPNKTGLFFGTVPQPQPGEIPFKVFRAFGDGIIKIDEEEVIRAVQFLYKMGLVVEPSGAAAVAAVLANKVPGVEGKRVVAFITGGNVSPDELSSQCRLDGF